MAVHTFAWPAVRFTSWAAADGLLVPVGGLQAGALHLPLLGGPVCVCGPGASALVKAMLLQTAARSQPEDLRVVLVGDVDPFRAAEWPSGDWALPPRLVDALDEMLRLAVEAPKEDYGRQSHADLLFEVLTAIGTLHALSSSQGGLLTVDRTPADEEERAWQGEKDLAFVHRCADGLAEVAAQCVRFAVWLWADLRPGWDQTNTKRHAAAEAREEALVEIGICAQRDRGRPLTADKNDVANFVRWSLLSAALACADAAHELDDSRFPGTAGSTMMDLAASILADGDEIATAAGYDDWPVLGDEW